jgi:hypothetical protein
MKLLFGLLATSAVVLGAKCGPEQVNQDGLLNNLRDMLALDTDDGCEGIWNYAKTLVPSKAIVCGANVQLVLTLLGRLDLGESVSKFVPLTTGVGELCPVTCDICSTEDCVDDPEGILAGQGSDCGTAKGLGCDFEFSLLNPTLPSGTTVASVCPKSCDACAASTPTVTLAETPTDTPSEPASDSPVCKDDPDGAVEAAGANCGLLAGLGCTTDLNGLDPSVAVGTFVWHACPVSCDKCEDFELLFADASPPAPNPSEAPAPPILVAPPVVAPPEELLGPPVDPPAPPEATVLVPPAAGLPPAPASPVALSPAVGPASTACQAPIRYQIVSKKNSKMCLSAKVGAAKTALVKCNAKDSSQLFGLADKVATTAGEACITTNKSGCKQKVVVANQFQGAKTFKAGKKCLNLNKRNKAVLSKCNPKAKSQAFYFVPLF